MKTGIDWSGMLKAVLKAVRPFIGGAIGGLISGCTVEGADNNGFAQNAAFSDGTLIDQITMTSLLYSSGFGMPGTPGGWPGGGPGGNPPGGPGRGPGRGW